MKRLLCDREARLRSGLRRPQRSIIFLAQHKRKKWWVILSEYNSDASAKQELFRKVLQRKNQIDRQFCIIRTEASVDFW